MDQTHVIPPSRKPPHVADELVYDFDYVLDPGFLRDPFERAVEVMAEAPPIFWTPRNGGHWMVTRFDAVTNAARDWETFSNVLIPKPMLEMMMAGLPANTPIPATALPSGVDPPEHSMYRAAVNPAFAPKVAMGLKEEIRGLAADLIERVRPAGRCELLKEIAEPLPVQMFLKLYGLPLERQQEYRAIVTQVMNAPFHDPQEMVRGAQTLIDTYTDTLIERRDAPRDDIISMMWQMKIDGQPMTLDVMQSYSLSLFLAGLDTVMNAMAHGTRHLAMHPELQAELRADPQRIPQMTDEMLRLYSFALPMRMVAHDALFEGVTMKQGERVHFFLPGADRDPAQFDDPNVLALERGSKAHVGFGAGPHRCLGMHLARVELHVYYEELLARLPAFRLDPERPPSYHGGMVIGPNDLHLLW